MCGINGFVGLPNGNIDRMNAATNHRGPDFAGTWTDGNMVFGHNLLSIRDAATVSKQPFTKENSPWVLVFNGQLYNTEQMREALDSSYQTVDLDTALLFGLVEKYGWSFTSYIQGMFAIGLYNTCEKILRLYRDPSGQKNLYYSHVGNSFIFSSEIKGVLSQLDSSDVDPEAVALATSFGWIPGDKTLFASIKKLNLSECLTYDVQKNTLHKQLFDGSPSHYYKNEDIIFSELIAEHLQSKQKLGLNLSGGLDSSLLLYEMSQVGHTISSYTTTFEDCNEKYNRDAQLAARLAKDFGAHHTEIPITKRKYLEHLQESYECIEEPNYNISLPTYLITAKHEGVSGEKNRVILSGDGGDEVFAGYPHYYQSIRINTRQKILTPFFFNLIKNWRNHTHYDFTNPTEQWLFFRNFSKNQAKVSVDRKKYLEEIATPYLRIYAQKNSSPYNLMMLDRLFWLGSENFIRTDKLYMSQSLEMRSPLTYIPFRKFFDSLLNTKDYINERTNKIYLRNYYQGKLPDYIVNRPDKTGWRSPLVDWYDSDFKKNFLGILSGVKQKDSLINWDQIIKSVEATDKWPGKHIHLYLSLALLAKKYKLPL